MKDKQNRTAPDHSTQGQANISTSQPQTIGIGEKAHNSRPSDECVERGVTDDPEVKKEDQRATRTRNNGVTADTQPPKKSSHSKPTFPEFLELAKQAISTTPSMTGLRSLQKLLKMGVSAKSSIAPLINDLFVLLKDWPECSRLALKLSVQTRAKRSSDLIRGLRNRLTSYSRSFVGYPESSESAVDQGQLFEAVIAWLERHLDGDRGVGKNIKAGPADLNWARWVAVCLMEEPLFVRTEGLYRLLEALCPRPVNNPGEAETVFFSEIGSLLDVDKLNARKIAAGLKLATGARTLGAETRGSLYEATATVRKQNAHLDELDSVVKTLTEAFTGATARIAELETQLLQKAQQVEQQKTERNLDKDHLEVLSEQRLTRMMNDFSGRLAHEIAEAKICLDGDGPNVRMAFDRLRQMEKILAKMRGA